MSDHQPFASDNLRPYGKLYFIWYFDDDKGYGIEVFRDDHSSFNSVVNWTFGHGTWARDLRRSWGDFAANRVAENQGRMPLDIEKIVLNFNVQKQVLEGDIEKVKKIIS